MKIQLLFFVIALCIITVTFGQPFQKYVGTSNMYHHDLNLEPINDGSNHFAVAGNLMDANFTSQLMALHRINQSGSVVWSNTYTSTASSIVRVLDMVNLFDKLYATGYVEANRPGMRSAFIAEIQASNGAVLSANFYDISGSNINSQGFKIVYTNSDANGDTLPDPGFLVAGYFGMCAPLNISCVLNIGFVLRTDISLNILWSKELENNNTTSGTFDYDFINDITETPTGFFLTGSITGQVTPGQDQQGVLAYKMDFMGNPLWDRSYIFGNSQDVSMDAYYDTATQSIFMLTNYSVSHYFGVTVMNDATGNPTGTSWYISGNDLNTYAFRILESLTSSNNLVITGYDRDENWNDALGNPMFGQTNLFVHEFVKATGVPLGNTQQFLVPHTEHGPDEFSFWSSQIPVIYYPDISLPYIYNDGTAAQYLHAGYRTEPSGNRTVAELFAMRSNNINECIRLGKPLTINPPILNYIVATSGNVPSSLTPLQLAPTALVTIEQNCDDTLLAIQDNPLQKIELYPNPATDKVYVLGENVKGFIIYDALGRNVKEGVLNSKKTLSVENLTAGVYLVKIMDENNNFHTIKLLKK